MKRNQGFTLVEVILVIAITGVIAGIFAMQLRPALQNYLAVGRRANLTHLADTALRRMVTEIRSAVPNSLRLASSADGKSTCLEMVPSSDGGRFRTAADADWDPANPAAASQPLDLSQPDQVFDVLSAFNGPVKAGDWVVIGNQNTADVYAGSDRATIAAISDPPATGAGKKSLGIKRISLTAAQQFPYGYEGGRFYIVPQALGPVSYICDNAGVDSTTGSGTGTLRRVVGYGFNASQSCPVSGKVGALVATKIKTCKFMYDPSQGATQQSGFAQLQLSLSDNGETATLTVGSQVENLP